jgi:hypothetical protein
MNCRHCGDKIGLIERWRYEHFCGKECKAQFEEESARLSLELLTHRTGKQEKPQATRTKGPGAGSQTSPAAPAPATTPAHEMPEPAEAAFLAQTEPGASDLLVQAVGFHKSPPLAAGRKDKAKGKEKDWPKFPEGGMPERIALEQETRRQKRALHQSVGLLPPPLLDDYWWPELLAVFSPETEHGGAEYAGMEAAWAVPLPPNERVVVARAEDLPGRSMLEWTAMEAVTEVPPLLLAGADVYLRGTGMESLDDRLEQVTCETEGWRVTETDFASTVVEPDRPRLGVPLAPIEIRTSPHGEPYRMVSRSAAPAYPPQPPQQPHQPPPQTAATWGAMMRHTLESAAVQQQHAQQQPAPPQYWQGPPAPQMAFGPATTPSMMPAPSPGVLLSSAAFQAPIALGAGGVMIQLVPNPGGFLTVPPRGACAGGSDLIAEAAEPRQQTVDCVGPESEFAQAAVSCGEAGLLALQEPVARTEAAGVDTLRYANPVPEPGAAASLGPTGLPASEGRPQLLRPHWESTPAGLQAAGEPQTIQAAAAIRRQEPQQQLPAAPIATATPCHTTASIDVRGFSTRRIVLQWVLQANPARAPRLPAAASRARLTAERAA